MDEEKVGFGRKLFNKFKDSFFAADMNNIGDFLLKEVVEPSAKDLASNIIDSTFMTLTNAKDIFIYGEAKARPGGVRPNYKGAFSNPSARRSTVISGSKQVGGIVERGGRHCFDNIFFPGGLKDCNDVLFEMAQAMDEYQRVSVAEFLEIAAEYSKDVPIIQHVDYNWGWTDLTTAAPKRVTGGWIITLPPVVYLKK